MEIKVDNAAIEKAVMEQIKMSMVEALSMKGDSLIRSVVHAAMTAKSNGYDRETLIESSLGKMIREQATGALQEWVDEHKPEIRRLVHKQLNDKQSGLLTSITNQLVASLQGGLSVSVMWRGQ